MGQQRTGRRLLLPVALAAGLFACASLPAMAANADYCVTCRGPDQIYRCRITDAGSRPSDALKLYCVIRTAQEGNHASCSAEKATSVCNGVVKVYSYTGPTLPQGAASDPRVQQLKQKIERDQEAFDKPKADTGAPKTLFQLGGRAVNASRKGLRNAGTALGVTSQPADQVTTAPADQGTTGAVQPQAPPPLPAEEAVIEQPEESPGLAKRAANAAQDAGSAVGGFTRRSYRCVVSFFRKCGGE